MNKRIISIILLPFLLGGTYYGVISLLFKEGTSVSSFPIPRFATEQTGANGQHYATQLASETDGPGLLYAARLNRDGWKKVNQEGAKILYRKGETFVSLTTFDEEVYVKPVRLVEFERLED
ncbi:hypothetical protein [Exiguobacterium sp. s127]|uniref:hypothetical protein n=1 Tax=Exiguobacterium sp. s127 TaxID=2751210 RepID=UPI001BEB7FD5|nr:hypothetical protein [Exiguobacterium sp. s127]